MLLKTKLDFEVKWHPLLLLSKYMISSLSFVLGILLCNDIRTIIVFYRLCNCTILNLFINMLQVSTLISHLQMQYLETAKLLEWLFRGIVVISAGFCWVFLIVVEQLCQRLCFNVLFWLENIKVEIGLKYNGLLGVLW
jgi:hypothetical protein